MDATGANELRLIVVPRRVNTTARFESSLILLRTELPLREVQETAPRRCQPVAIASSLEAAHAHARTSSRGAKLCPSSSDSREDSTMYFLEMTFRDWNIRFDPMAVVKPYLTTQRPQTQVCPAYPSDCADDLADDSHTQRAQHSIHNEQILKVKSPLVYAFSQVPCFSHQSGVDQMPYKKPGMVRALRLGLQSLLQILTPR